jgi:hypothetical protein
MMHAIRPRQAAAASRLEAYAPQTSRKLLQLVPGSARVSRVGFGVSPKQSLQKVRDDETSLPTRETRALPGLKRGGPEAAVP